jgi:hypothetical protein
MWDILKKTTLRALGAKMFTQRVRDLAYMISGKQSSVSFPRSWRHEEACVDIGNVNIAQVVTTFSGTYRTWRFFLLVRRYRHWSLSSTQSTPANPCAYLLPLYLHPGPITVAARSEVWTVFVRSDTGVVGPNLTQVMDVCVRLFHVCAVLRIGSGLATGWSTVREVLPTVYRIKKLKNRRRSNKGL